MNLPDAPIANEGFFVTHFFTVRDQEKSKDFYVRILGGKVVKPENPCYIKLANTWIIFNSGGGPTPDKPEVLLAMERARTQALIRCAIPVERGRGGPSASGTSKRPSSNRGEVCPKMCHRCFACPCIGLHSTATAKVRGRRKQLMMQ